MGNELEIFLQELEELMGMGLVTMLLSEIPSMLISLATYVLTAVALYTIAKRRGINHPWLAWIPIANMWLLGCIADQYRYVARGENKSRRKVLLGTNIATNVISIVILVLCFSLLFSILSVGLDNLENMSESMAADMLSAIMGPMVGMLLLCLPLMVMAIVHMVFYYIALHDIYKSCDPGNATLYLVLSIVIGITLPIFLMICRNNDFGMPPRQQPQPVVDAPQPSDEPQDPVKSGQPQQPEESSQQNM